MIPVAGRVTETGSSTVAGGDYGQADLNALLLQYAARVPAKAVDTSYPDHFFQLIMGTRFDERGSDGLSDFIHNFLERVANGPSFEEQLKKIPQLNRENQRLVLMKAYQMAFSMNNREAMETLFNSLKPLISNQCTSIRLIVTNVHFDRSLESALPASRSTLLCNAKIRKIALPLLTVAAVVIVAGLAAYCYQRYNLPQPPHSPEPLPIVDEKKFPLPDILRRNSVYAMKQAGGTCETSPLSREFTLEGGGDFAKEVICEATNNSQDTVQACKNAIDSGRLLKITAIAKDSSSPYNIELSSGQLQISGERANAVFKKALGLGSTPISELSFEKLEEEFKFSLLEKTKQTTRCQLQFSDARLEFQQHDEELVDIRSQHQKLFTLIPNDSQERLELEMQDAASGEELSLSSMDPKLRGFFIPRGLYCGTEVTLSTNHGCRTYNQRQICEPANNSPDSFQDKVIRYRYGDWFSRWACSDAMPKS